MEVEILVKSMVSLAKWLSVCLRTKWLWVRVQLQSLKLGKHLLIVRDFLFVSLTVVICMLSYVIYMLLCCCYGASCCFMPNNSWYEV